MPTCWNSRRRIARSIVVPLIRRCSNASARRPLVGLLAACVAGAAFDRNATIPVAAWCLGVFGTTLVWCRWYRCRRRRAAAAAMLLNVALLGGLWHHVRWHAFEEHHVVRYARSTGTPVCLRVVALDAVRRSPAARFDPLTTTQRGPASRLIVRALAIRDGQVWRVAQGRIAVWVNGRLPPIWPGDRILVRGQLRPVEPPKNPGEPDFASIYRRRRILVSLSCSRPQSVVPFARFTGISAVHSVARFRVWAEQTLKQSVGDEQFGLAAALLLGSRERLRPDQVDRFFRSGVLHLLAISGFHVGILVVLPWLILHLDWFPRSWVLTLTTLLAGAYCLVADVRAPVVRAVLLIVFACAARGSGRYLNAWNALAGAGLLSFAYRPASAFSVGTQLSFLAVAVLIGQWPILTARPEDPLRRLIWSTRPIWMRASRWTMIWLGRLLLTSTIVWMVTLPLAASRFHLVAPVGLVASALLWLPVALVLFSGLAVLVAAAVLPAGAGACGTVCAAGASWVDGAATLAAQWPGGHWWIPDLWSFWVAVWYLGCLAMNGLSYRIPWRWVGALGMIWVAIAVSQLDRWRPIGRSSRPAVVVATFADVGHGTAVLLEFPSGYTLLYDAGSLRGPRAATRSVAHLLWARGIGHLDAVVLSHADIDHFNGVPGLLERFSVGEVLMTGQMAAATGRAVRAVRRAIDRAGVPTVIVGEGDRLVVGSRMVVQVLHPPRPVATQRSDHHVNANSHDNANSMVLLIDTGQCRLLLPGDLEGTGLDELLSEMPLHCQFLMAPHHGSQNSRPDAMFQWCQPKWVVVSGERDRPDGFNAMRDRHSDRRFLETAGSGAVQLVLPADKATDSSLGR